MDLGTSKMVNPVKKKNQMGLEFHQIPLAMSEQQREDKEQIFIKNMNIRNFTDVKSLFFDNKTLKQTIFKNTFWLAVAEVVQGGIGFLVAVWLARHFGPTIYGKFVFALSFAALFSILADFGFGALTIREIARDKSKTAQYIDNIVAMKLILGLVTLGIIALAIQFLGKEPEVVKLVYFLGIYAIINTFATFFQSIFQANEKMQCVTACRILQSLSLLGLVAFFILNKGSILTISYAYLGGALIGTILSLGVVWCYFLKFFLKINFEICKEILKETWPIALSGIFAIAYTRVDTLMLSLMKTDSVVGWYNAAYNPILALMIIPTLFMVSVYPKLSQAYLKSKDLSIKLYKKSLKYIFTLSIILFPLLFLFSKQIVLLLYDKSYANSIIVFKILLWTSFFAYLSCVFSYTLYAMNRQIIYTKVLALCLVINIILNFLLIPKYSYIGASVAAVIPQFLQFLLLFLFIKNFYYLK